MLILSRKLNESLVIDGSITVKILRIDGDQVRIGIQAPSDVPVHRQEVYDEIQRTNREAATQVRPNLPRLPGKPIAAPKNSVPTATSPQPAPNIQPCSLSLAQGTALETVPAAHS